MEIWVRRVFACAALAQVAFERGGRRVRGWVARYSVVFGRWWWVLFFGFLLVGLISWRGGGGGGNGHFCRGFCCSSFSTTTTIGAFGDSGSITDDV